MIQAPGAFPVRRAGPRDLESIAAIQAASPEAAQWEPASYLEHRCFVAVAGGDVVGFIVLRELAVDEYEILNLAVVPGRRRNGVGKMLIIHVLNGLQATVYLEVRESNQTARRFYESIGFSTHRIRKSYYSKPTEAAIEMRFQSC